jgi:hypothetical protein
LWLWLWWTFSAAELSHPLCHVGERSVAGPVLHPLRSVLGVARLAPAPAPASVPAVADALEEDLGSVAAGLRRIVASLGSYRGNRAPALVSLLAEIEKAAASGSALLTPAVIRDGSYAKEGFASAPDWLGSLCGSSRGVAKGRLAAAECAARSPELSQALGDAKLSAAQLKTISDAAALVPEAPGALLPLIAGGASHQELTAAATRLEAASRSARCERERRGRVHARRHLGWRLDHDGAIRGEFSCDPVRWAPLAAQIDAEAKARWKAAGAGASDSFEAHRLDVFLEHLAGSGSGSGSGVTQRARAVVLVNAESLRRGSTKEGETCEIDGIGPVSVEAATELLGEAALEFVIKDGLDIATVTGTSRAIKKRITVALLVRDRRCVVPSCGKEYNLEHDHSKVDYGADGPSELANLARLCAACHDLKTNGGWKLGGGPGHWSWDPPPDPPSAGAIKRRRKVATARAKGRREAAKAVRNQPRRS